MRIKGIGLDGLWVSKIEEPTKSAKDILESNERVLSLSTGRSGWKCVISHLAHSFLEDGEDKTATGYSENWQIAIQTAYTLFQRGEK